MMDRIVNYPWSAGMAFWGGCGLRIVLQRGERYEAIWFAGHADSVSQSAGSFSTIKAARAACTVRALLDTVSALNGRRWVVDL